MIYLIQPANNLIQPTQKPARLISPFYFQFSEFTCKKQLKSLNKVHVMLIVKIIYTAFMVWLISLFFAFLESLWESRKNNKP